MKVCKECGQQFTPLNQKAIFCSKKCRQKDYRKTINNKLQAYEKAIAQNLDTPEIKKAKKETLENLVHVGQSVTHEPSLTTGTTIDEVKQKVTTDDLKKQLEAIQNEAIPKERDTLLGRKAWNIEQQNRINQLKKLLNGTEK